MYVNDYVLANKEVIEFVQKAVPGAIDKYVGTLDFATARFNTILLALSQDPLRADEYRNDIEECFNVIQSFHQDTKKYLIWPYFFKPLMALKLHWSGKTQIPKIKFLLEKIDN